MSIDDTPYFSWNFKPVPPPTQPRWEIEIARYFGYNETTLALIKSPKNENYLVRCAGYPYGRPKMDSARDKNLFLYVGNIEAEKPHWNDFLNHLMNKYGENLSHVGQELSALPFIPCRHDDPKEEFEILAEEERFLMRQELFDKYFKLHEQKVEAFYEKHNNPREQISTPKKLTGLRALTHRLFSRSDNIQQVLEPKAPPIRIPSFSPGQFLNLDVDRNVQYEAESKLFGNGNPIKDQYLNQEEAQKLITRVCDDFSLPYPRHTSLRRQHFNARVKGSYNPATTDMWVEMDSYNNRISRHTLLHELSHHLDNTLVEKTGSRGVGHGKRFKRILMNLLHNYSDVPVEILKTEMQHAYGHRASFGLRDQDIIGRDFDETRTHDITYECGKFQSGITLHI